MSACVNNLVCEQPGNLALSLETQLIENVNEHFVDYKYSNMNSYMHTRLIQLRWWYS